MRTVIFCLLIFSSPLIMLAQSDLNVITFPDDWIGSYSGKMYIYTAKMGLVDSVDLKLDISKTEKEQKWKYQMTFDNARYGKIVKDYRIITNDTLPANVYLMDELNGIYIQQVLMGNTFYSSFSVAGNRLFSILRNERDYIEFEISSIREEKSLKSQSKGGEDEKVFEVLSFAPFTTQRAYLFRNK